MANSIEVRSPLLDYRLVEHGLRFIYHIKNGYDKYLDLFQDICLKKLVA